MTVYETSSLIVAILALVVSSAVMILLVWQLRLLRRQVTDSREALDRSIANNATEDGRRRKQATLEFSASTGQQLDRLYANVPAAGSPAYRSFLAAADVQESREYLTLRDYHNYLERVAVGVNQDVFDLEIVSRTMGGRILRAWELHQEWIEQERERLRRRTLWNDTEDLVAKIRTLRRLTYGDPPESATAA